VMKREPFLLLDTGDPSSLTTATRDALLIRVVERIAAGDEIPLLDGDNLRRFCQPDLAAVVRKLWQKYTKHQDVRRLLLRLIWLGEIAECADLAIKIALDPTSNQREALFAGRALMVVADTSTKEKYARLVTDHAPILSPTVVWNAAEGLFPK
jgi:AcrR family transcriptional regulator